MPTARERIARKAKEYEREYLATGSQVALKLAGVYYRGACELKREEQRKVDGGEKILAALDDFCGAGASRARRCK